MTNPSKPSLPSKASPDPEHPPPTVVGFSSTRASSTWACANPISSASTACSISDRARVAPPSLVSFPGQVPPRNIFLPTGMPPTISIPSRSMKRLLAVADGHRAALMMPLLGLGGGIQVYGGAGRSGDRGSFPQEGQSSVRRKIDSEAPEKYSLVCSDCGRGFPSWQGLFGHLRLDAVRQQPGCYPTPLINQEMEGEASTNIRRGGRHGVLDIDLNQPPQEMEEDSDAGDEPESGRGGIDLNKPPPREENN